MPGIPPAGACVFIHESAVIIKSRKMQNFEQLRDIIEREIEKMDFAGRRPGELYLPVAYCMSNGGKRIRPVLTLMACRLFSDDLSPAIKPALAIEVFHNFTLLHDDIMDKAEMRRNRPTVHKKWNENTAILAGDAMAIISFDLISSADPGILPELLAVFNRTALEICEGQQLDMNFETMPRVSEPMYLEMIRLKTSVLIATAIKTGAIAGGASEKDASLLYDSGLNLGLAFQLQDDLLDLYGDQEKFGKKPGGDILMKKKTFLLVKAMEMADKETAGKIEYLMEKEQDPEIKVHEMKNIFDRLDLQTITGRKASEYFDAAIEKLNCAVGGSPARIELAGFISKIMKRKS